MKQILSVLIIITLFFTSCTTEFDVIDEWQDITVVYCLLNQNDTVHYAKIEKAFLGTADAYDMAQISDSLYYKNLTVWLKKLGTDNVVIDSFLLEKTTEIQKDSVDANGNPGIFAYDNNVLYKTNTSLSPAYKYKLVVENNETGKIVSGETELISPLYFSGGDIPSIISMMNYDNFSKIYVTTVPNSRIYNVSAKFHYYEVNVNNSEIIGNYTIDWNIGSRVSNDANGGQEMTFDLSTGSFLKTIAANVPEKEENIIRVVDLNALDLIFEIGGEDLYTYMEVNGPSFGLIQEKPEYSNIENGIGLMSAIYKQTILNKKMTDRTVDSIAHSIYTSDLGFVDHTNFYYSSQ